MPAIVEVRRREPLRALHYLGPADKGRLEELLEGTVYKVNDNGSAMIVGNADNYHVSPGDWVVKLPEDSDLLVYAAHGFWSIFEAAP